MLFRNFRTSVLSGTLYVNIERSEHYVVPMIHSDSMMVTETLSSVFHKIQLQMFLILIDFIYHRPLSQLEI